MSTVKVGIIGLVNESQSRSETWKLVEKGLETVSKNFPNSDIEVVSTLQDFGVPQSAYYQASQKGYVTTGIAPDAVLSDRIYPCDNMIRAGERWGDDVETFVDYIDVLVSIGRNASTKSRITEARKRGITVHEYKLEE